MNSDRAFTVEIKPGERKTFRFVIWHNDRCAVIRDEAGELQMLELREAIPENMPKVMFQRDGELHDAPFSRSEIEAIECYRGWSDAPAILSDKELVASLDAEDNERNTTAGQIAPDIYEAFKNRTLGVLKSRKSEIESLFDFAVQFMLNGRSNPDREDKCYHWEDVLFVRTKSGGKFKNETVADLLNKRIAHAELDFEKNQTEAETEIANDAKRDFEEAQNSLPFEYADWLNTVFFFGNKTKPGGGQTADEFFSEHRKLLLGFIRACNQVNPFWPGPKHRIRFADGSAAFLSVLKIRRPNDESELKFLQRLSVDLKKPLFVFRNKCKQVDCPKGTVSSSEINSRHFQSLQDGRSIVCFLNESSRLKALRKLLKNYQEENYGLDWDFFRQEFGIAEGDGNPARAFETRADGHKHERSFYEHIFDMPLFESERKIRLNPAYRYEEDS